MSPPFVVKVNEPFHLKNESNLTPEFFYDNFNEII